ncbi:aldo-keto reductase family 1 member A1 isoform X1 [Halyomorpha halys]|uniref:aldo-keto reductase family 1 member A1 isoform X1 n=1 Tax=Halyomorpha halys TaxID=286706 RepID=UPI0006D4CFCB|nr:alcohol dehydrogenase [NADP(+)]-like isoform X1 [Halyomorpha halys]
MDREMSIKLQNEITMPLLGITTHSTQQDEPWGEIVKCAIDIGYRHIDCASVNQNERIIGEAIAEKIAQGEIEREEIFVTSKLWNNKHEKEAVVPALKRTLANLGLQYLDLYLIHWPFSFPDVPGELYPRDANRKVLTTEIDFKNTWKGMEECIDKGLAKSIGLSNFNLHQLREVCRTAKIKPSVLQIECHPYLAQLELIKVCKSKNIEITAYMPLGKRIPPMRGRSLIKDPVLVNLGLKHKRTPAQIALRYQMDRGVAALPRTLKKERLKENFNIFDFSLSEKDILVLDCLNKDERYMELKEYSNHKYYPFENVPHEQEPTPAEVNQ